MKKLERKIEKLENRAITFKRNKRVAAYCRVSMDCDKLKNSFANQVSYYSDLIQKNPSWEYAGVYSDYAVSGTGILKRKGFNDMVREAKNGNIDIILTKSISRFARNTVDLLKVVRELREKNVEIRFEKENINTLSTSGELMLSLLGSFAQSEAETISSNVKHGIKMKFQLGIGMKNNLFGYDYKDKKYTINKEEAKVVKKVFKLFNEGLSYTELAKVVNDLGARTRNDLKFDYGSIKQMLTQEKYAGFSIAQKRYVESPLTHKAKRNKGELPMYRIDGTHPAIISEEVFNMAKERIKFVHDNHRAIHPQSSWFTSLVKCPVCGSNFIKISYKSMGCIGNHKPKNKICNNVERLSVADLEEFCKGLDLSKVENIIYKKTRFERFSRKGRKPGDNKVKKATKGDFEIIWK